MSLHHTLACDSPASRRVRWCAPLLLVGGLMALALAPGLITGDKSFETSLCGDLEQAPGTCAQAMHDPGADLATRALDVP